MEQNSISLDSKYVRQFSEIASELDMAIAITLLEKHEPKPRNTVCLFDAGENFYVEELDTKEGVFLAELDVDMLRKYRSGEIGGLKIEDQNYIGLSLNI